MRIIEVPFVALRFQFQLVRLPLRLIEEKIFARLDEEAPARLAYERSLGVLDATVGGVLRDPKTKNRGMALIERSDALGRASRLDAVATKKQKKAKADLLAIRATTERDVAQARTAADARQQPASDAAEQRSTAAAESKLDDAKAKREQADRKRAEADRVEELVDVEKQNRQAARAGKS